MQYISVIVAVKKNRVMLNVAENVMADAISRDALLNFNSAIKTQIPVAGKTVAGFFNLCYNFAEVIR